MTAKQLKTLEKVHNLASKPGTPGEGKAARKKLESLCKKYKIRLSDHIKDCAFDFDFRPDKPTAAEMLLKKYRSRRAAMIDLLPDNIWDTDTLAHVLSEVYGFGTVAKCKKAIGGITSDYTKQKKWNWKVNDDGRRCYTMA